MGTLDARSYSKSPIYMQTLSFSLTDQNISILDICNINIEHIILLGYSSYIYKSNMLSSYVPAFLHYYSLRATPLSIARDIRDIYMSVYERRLDHISAPSSSLLKNSFSYADPLTHTCTIGIPGIL